MEIFEIILFVIIFVSPILIITRMLEVDIVPEFVKKIYYMIPRINIVRNDKNENK